MYAGLAGGVTVMHPFLAADIRTITYLLVSALTLVPLTGLVRRLDARRTCTGRWPNRSARPANR